jgi:hypothetical protein
MQLKYIGDEFVRKNGLMFIQLDGGPICMPIETTLPASAQRILLSQMKWQFRIRDILRKKGWDYYSSVSVLPVQRRFHRTRIKGFPVKWLKDYRRELRTLRLRP